MITKKEGIKADCSSCGKTNLTCTLVHAQGDDTRMWLCAYCMTSYERSPLEDEIKALKEGKGLLRRISLKALQSDYGPPTMTDGEMVARAVLGVAQVLQFSILKLPWEENPHDPLVIELRRRQAERDGDE